MIKNIKEDCSKYYGIRNRLGLVLGPVLFVLILSLSESLMDRDARIVAAVAGLMACWWICESLPLAATALLPLVAFPLMKVVPAKEVAASYASSSIFLFMGGFFIAVAMKKWNLHRRIALGILSVVGMSGDRVILGFMLSTAFLSMWISNTATTMMMLPIGLAILMTLEEGGGTTFSTSGFQDGKRALGKSKGIKENHSSEEKYSKESPLSDPESPNSSSLPKESWGFREGVGVFGFKMALMLSIAYAANIGGIGTLIGTPPNVVFASQVQSLYPEAGEISFVEWMMVGFPLVAVFIPVTWLILTKVLFKGAGDLKGGEMVIGNQRKALGPMNAGEKRTLAVFLVTVIAWITRADINLGFFTFRGWASAISLDAYIHDATVAVAAGVALFVIPVNWEKGQFVLDWKSAREIPWGILILFGGGIALGRGFSESGLAARLASTMNILDSAPIIVILIVTCLIVTFLTEITSNTAIATIFLPILGATALGLGIHPFTLMIPATVSASCAFMLPVATPPNAIVFSSGSVSMPGMVRVGIVLNFIGVVLVVSMMYFIVSRVFGFSFTQPPEWAVSSIKSDFYPLKVWMDGRAGMGKTFQAAIYCFAQRGGIA